MVRGARYSKARGRNRKSDGEKQRRLYPVQREERRCQYNRNRRMPPGPLPQPTSILPQWLG